MNVFGVDGAPKGWAAARFERGQVNVRLIKRLDELFSQLPYPDIVAVDIPIGLLDVYEIGGRECDRKARRDLGKRGSSVFAPPVRAVLNAKTYEDAKALSGASSKHNRALSRQTWGLFPRLRKPTICCSETLLCAPLSAKFTPKCVFANSSANQ